MKPTLTWSRGLSKKENSVGASTRRALRRYTTTLEQYKWIQKTGLDKTGFKTEASCYCSLS